MRQPHKRGQAALEFLMTYSWAILVVIIVIGALAYFGVLNPSNLIPSTCTVSAGLSCDDYVLTEDGDASINLVNGLGRPIYVTEYEVRNINDQSCAGDPGEWSTPTMGSPDTLPMDDTDSAIPNGGTVQLDMTDCSWPNPGNKNRAYLTIRYQYADSTSGFEHTATGEIFALPQ